LGTESGTDSIVIMEDDLVKTYNSLPERTSVPGTINCGHKDIEEHPRKMGLDLLLLIPPSRCHLPLVIWNYTENKVFCFCRPQFSKTLEHTLNSKRIPVVRKET